MVIIFILSERSRPLAERLRSAMPEAEIVCCSTALLRPFFLQGYTLIGICSTGILIRTLGPILGKKTSEPAVIAVSTDGKRVIPLLGGHRGGNRLASQVGKVLRVEPSLTTLSDPRFGIALDEPPDGWYLATPERVKQCVTDLLNGAKIRLEGQAPWLEESRLPWSDEGEWTLRTTVYKDTQESEKEIVYHPYQLALGVGCEKGTSSEELETLVFETLDRYGLAWRAIGVVASIEDKMGEPALSRLSRLLEREERFFSAVELERERDRLRTPSEQVYQLMKCHGVAEGAALAAVGPQGQLLIAKQKSKRATCAVAQASFPLDPSMIGKGVGTLAVVGVGPGKIEYCLPHALACLRECDHLVGYSGYLELVDAFALKGERHPFPLGQERDRARYALDLAANGHRVGLISSGDPGIYAMATVVFEILDREPTVKRERVEIMIYPGLSAMQTLASMVGAPLGHDFCVISLSDLLTPWTVIEKRLLAAAQGDFTVVLYNPLSKRRRWQLQRAQEILSAYRRGQTAVVVGRNLCRNGQNVSLLTLDTLDPNQIDMLSIVIVGSSRIKNFTTSLGQSWVYTPRD